MTVIQNLSGTELVGITAGADPNAKTTTKAISNLASGGSLTVTDGTNTVAGTTQLTVTGGTIGGSTPNATLAISGLTGFTASLDTTAPNDTINASVLAASGGTAKQDISIVPRGDSDTGFAAFQLSIPDGTQVGGNKRGSGAVDLQQDRNVASEVASGIFSFVVGEQNTASGRDSAAIGAVNVASGHYAVALGNSNTADADASLALGRNSLARGIISAEVFGLAPGFQRGHYGLIITTADATPTVLTSDGGFGPTANNQVALPSGANGALGATYKFRGQVVAVDTATGHSSGWDFTGTIKQRATAASTALVAAVMPTLAGQDAALAATVVAISADTTNGALAVTVTGIAATNIQWMCDVWTSETTY